MIETTNIKIGIHVGQAMNLLATVEPDLIKQLFSEEKLTRGKELKEKLVLAAVRMAKLQATIQAEAKASWADKYNIQVNY